MLFNSTDFLLFFPVVTIIYYVIPYKLRYLWLLACSYYFYMCWNPKYIILLLFSTVVTYLSGLIIEWLKRSDLDAAHKIIGKNCCVAGSFALNLSLLGFFKYFDLFMGSLSHVLGLLHIRLIVPSFDFLLPVGISFYTFQALSYTMDVYRDDIYAEKNFFKYALFVSFFPQLVAGPIERSKNLLIQINEKHPLKYDNVRDGLFLIFWGYFLKLVLADRIAIVVDTVYDNPTAYGGFYLVVATVLFAFQILCDFNGYTTIARGAALIMGFRLMENFNAPYFADNVADFWRRWHISLTSWFKDYLYIPLGGNRKGKLRKYLNIMIVFTVSGLWHGASFAFVLWGGLNGLYQVIGEILKPVREYLVQKFHICREGFSHHILKVITTFAMVDFAWLFFRAGSIGKSKEVLKNMLYFNPEILLDGSIYALGLGETEFHFLLCALIVLAIADYFKYRKINVLHKLQQQGMLFRSLAFALLFCAVILFGVFGPDYEASQFIYFQF